MEIPASKGFYEDGFQEAQMWGRWVLIFAIRVIPACAIFLLVAIYFLYFISDLGNDVFILAVPMW